MESWLAHQGSLGRRVTLPLYPAHGLKFSLSCLLCFIISDHWLVQVRAAVLKKKQWKRDKHHWWWTRTARFYAVSAGVWYRLVQLQNSLQQFVVLFEVFIFIFKLFEYVHILRYWIMFHHAIVLRLLVNLINLLVVILLLAVGVMVVRLCFSFFHKCFKL